MNTPAALHDTLCVAPAHPCLAGHFPGRALVPGVLLLDALAALLARHNLAIVEVSEAKFHTPLAPAQAATLVIIPGAADASWRFEITAAARLIASGRLRTRPA